MITEKIVILQTLFYSIKSNMMKTILTPPLTPPLQGRGAATA